jgi:hypothetical protein
MLLPDSATHKEDFDRYPYANLLRLDFCDCRIWPISAPILGFPDDKNEGRRQASRDKHPVLAVETQKVKMLNQKLHRFRPLFLQNRRFACAG